MAMARTALREARLKAEDLTGRQKAAVLLMALGPEASKPITQALTPEEVEEITLEIARLETVPPDVVEAVLDEWRRMEEAAHSLAQGGVEYAKQILEQTFGPQRAAVILKRIESQLRESAGFRVLRNVDPQQLTTLLRNEHPQTISLILAHLEPGLVADVLKQLDPKLGALVLYRMARMDKVMPDVLQAVERSLGSDATVNLAQDMTRAGGPAAVAAVLNHVAGSLEKDLLEGIARQDPELCEEIKSLMFVFEDIVRLDDRALQRVLQSVDARELALALKAASDEVKSRIRSVMSQRAATALQEEMELLGPVRLRDVEEAQATIVKTIRALEESGEIVIGGAADEVIL
ncbi:MAG: flagellar motor switch protein FliG [Gemmatimonadota bacterium]|jgi:flagellar motor switch protein FliG